MPFSTSSRPSEGSDARQPGLGAFLRRKGIGVKERGDEGDVKLTEMSGHKTSPVTLSRPTTSKPPPATALEQTLEDKEVAVDPRKFSPGGDGQRGLNDLPDEMLQIILQYIPPENKINSSPFGSLGLTCARLEHLVRTFNGSNQLWITRGENKPITDEFVLRTFRRRRGVSRVVLHGLATLSSDTFIRMAQLPSEYYKNFVEIELCDCKKLNATCLNTFIKKCPSLTVLVLYDIPAAAANLTFAAIRETCQHLRTIDVGAYGRKFTSRITKTGISNITMPLADSPSCLAQIRLPRLDMAKIGQYGIDMMADRLHASLGVLELPNPKGECPSVKSLGKLTHLRVLSLAGWSFSSMEPLASALTSLKELKLLDLSESSIDDAGLSLLTKSLPRMLRLCSCQSVSDDGVISILENCDQLEMLNLSCNRKDPFFIDTLADSLRHHTGNENVRVIGSN